MPLYPIPFGYAELPETDERRPHGRPDGVRTVRRPAVRADGRL
jgi:hypothetical protein